MSKCEKKTSPSFNIHVGSEPNKKPKIAVDVYAYGDGSAAIRLGRDGIRHIAYLTPELVKFVRGALAPEAEESEWNLFAEEIIPRPWYHR